MQPDRIGDHAVIGDGRTAALVSRSGSINWLCWPRFDGEPLFASILDPERGGCFRVAPSAPGRVERRYLPDTNVLETRFVGPGGTLVVIDFMPVARDDEQRRALRPQHELARLVRCERGEVPVEVTYAPRPGFGARPPRIRDAGGLGLRVELRGALITLRSERRLELGPDGVATGSLLLRAGDVARFSLSYSDEAPAVLSPLGARLDEELDETLRYWRTWLSAMRYDGPYREAVARSALALKLMQYAPSGAIVAAPTTSLPERLGGDLNWDYRFCWLRDAAFTARALFGLGFLDEARAFTSWLLHATRQTLPEIRVLYDVYGRRVPAERVVDELAGYAGSRPVRVGNAAQEQLQLDVYGEVLEAVIQLARHDGALDRETSKLLLRLGDTVCQRWREPDEGIWEPREGRREHTHSKALAWAALHCILLLDEDGLLERPVPRERLARQRDEIARALERHGFDEELGSYVQAFGEPRLDASLLQLAFYGYREASDPRMRATIDRVRERLDAGPGLLYRYEASRGREGAFIICSFWLVEALALGGGTLQEARSAFEACLAVRNDVGLLAEEVSPETGEQLGNFPQAFSHIGLISAALRIAERARAEVPARVEAPQRAVSREGGPPP